MKTYEAVFNVAKNKGVYGISLVEEPAMEGTFITLNKQIQLKTVNEEERILMGLVLEPNKPIYRNQGGEEFNLIFSEDTIKDLSHNFFKQGYQTNSSIEHNESIEGISIVQSWTVEDTNVDKSANFGFSYPKGSWVAMMKIDSEEIWQDYIKTGDVKGFSIDAFVELQEVKLNKHKMEENKTIIELIKDIPNQIKLALTPKAEEIEVVEEEVKLGSVKSADGAMEFMYDGESLEVGGAIWLVAEDGTKVPVPVGEHAIEGGTLVVAEEGIVGEVKATVAEEEAAPLAEASPAAQASPSAESVVGDIKSLLIKYAEESKAERVAFEKVLDDKLEVMDGKLVEFSKQPAAKPTATIPTQVEYSKMTNFEKLKHNESIGKR